MNIGKWFVMLVVMLALTGFVLAESNDTNSTNTNSTDDFDINATNSQALIVRYDHLQCKVAFTNTQIDLLKEYVSVDQIPNKEELLVDMITLKTYVNSTNKEGFDNYSVQTVRPDLQKATQDLNDAKKNFKRYNVTNESRTAFTNELKDAKKVYSSCVDDKEVKMAKVMEKHMENWNKQLAKISDNMDKKNITTANMTAIMDEIDARNAKLRELITSGNITTIRDFMKVYYEDQLRYAARFETARLKGYRDKLEPLADKYNMSGKFRDIDSKIANVEEHAKERYKYSDDEREKVWEDIKGIGKDMKDTAKNINDERVKEQQGKVNNRQQQEGRIGMINNSGEDN